jgi:hypothetical protein
MELFGFLVIWALLSGGIAALADSRGRSSVGFFLMSFLLSPLLGLIVVLVMSNLSAEEEKAVTRRREEESREKLRAQEHERQLESIKAIALPKQATPVSASVSSSFVPSVADEIRKLGQLREEGLLTDDEFQSQKVALLASPSPPSAHSNAASNSSREPEPSSIKRFGTCPNCKNTIPLLSEHCPHCPASFKDGSAWPVKAI